jgi:AcrR family transcriptional regulator
MATKTKGEVKVPVEVTKEKIRESYMQYCLENNQSPVSVYLFAKQLGISEKEFYQHFASIEAIEKSIFLAFHHYTMQLIRDSGETLDFKEQLLTYYFTFFELLTANRSYVMLALNGNKNKLSGLLKLKPLRDEFKSFIAEASVDYEKVQNEKLRKVQQQALEEGGWIQLLLTMKFWMDDDSAGFEKTDLFIEKSIRATFDLISYTPLESVLDFGKFIIKERFR